MSSFKSEVAQKETHLGDYIVKLHTVDASKLAENASASSVAGRFKLMAKLVIRGEQDKDRLGTNLCYKKTAEWLLSHKDEWDNFNIVILALKPNLAVHVLVTNQENSTVISEFLHFGTLAKSLEGYFLSLTQLKQIYGC